MIDNREYLLREAPVKTAIIKLTIPAILGTIISAVYNIVDGIFVGRLGEDEITATAIVMPIFFFIGAIGNTFGVGSASYVSRLLGENRTRQAETTIATGLFFSIIFSILTTLIFYFLMFEILNLFGCSDELQEVTQKYTKWLIFGAASTIFNNFITNILRAEGSAKIAMISISLGALLNIILAPIFIFTLKGGVEGASIATMISQVISSLVIIIYYLSGKSLLKMDIRLLRFKKEILIEIGKMGLPSLLRQGLYSTSIALLYNVAAGFGSDVIATIGIVSRVYAVPYMIIFGTNMGVMPITGYAHGAQNSLRLKKTMKISLTFLTIFCSVMTLFYILFSKHIAILFNSSGSIAEIIQRGIIIGSFSLPFAGIIILIHGLYQALGLGLISNILTLAKQGLFLIPMILILPTLIGIDGVLSAQVVADILILILTILFATRLKRYISY